MAFSDNHKDGRVIISVHSMSEQHQKALSAAGRFNPLNRHTGVASLSWVSFRGEVANSAPIIRSVPPQEINTSYL